MSVTRVQRYVSYDSGGYEYVVGFGPAATL